MWTWILNVRPIHRIVADLEILKTVHTGFADLNAAKKIARHREKDGSTSQKI